jgi:hypothetical protein
MTSQQEFPAARPCGAEHLQAVLAELARRGAPVTAPIVAAMLPLQPALQSIGQALGAINAAFATAAERSAGGSN